MSLLTPSHTPRVYRWTDWKVVRTAKSLRTQYESDGLIYTIWGYDGPEVHITTIWLGTVPQSVVDGGYSQAQNDADKSDFVTNFLPTANSTVSIDVYDGQTATAAIRGAAIAGQTASGALKWLRLSDDGYLVTTESAAATDPTLLYANKCKNGGSSNLLVNASLGSPQHFDVTADPTKDILLSEIRFAFSCGAIVYDGNSFGQATKLTNGILVALTVNNGVSVTLTTIQQNEHFSEFATSAGINLFSEFSGTNDHMVASYSLFNSMRLKANTADRIRVSVRDNITATQFKYLQASVYGRKV